MHAEGSATPRVGVPGALGEQAHRRARSGRARPRTDEPAERARLADLARLSVAHAEVAALTVHGSPYAAFALSIASVYLPNRALLLHQAR